MKWNIGESAGALAAYCCQEGCTPRQVWATGALLRRFQRRLLARGVPQAWTADVPETHECFVPTQVLVTLGAIPSGDPRFETLDVRPEAALTGAEAAGLLGAGLRLMGEAGSGQGCPRSEPWSERWDTYPDSDLAIQRERWRKSADA